MQKAWAGKADFVTVYIKEAHPTDEWQLDDNETEDVCYPQPTKLSERLAIARDFQKRHSYDITLLVDDMKNTIDDAYAAWPERLYVIETDGKIAYKGATGPFGFHPEEVEQWLAQRFGTP